MAKVKEEIAQMQPDRSMNKKPGQISYIRDGAPDIGKDYSGHS